MATNSPKTELTEPAKDLNFRRLARRSSQASHDFLGKASEQHDLSIAERQPLRLEIFLA
jgi:hypothetical protein